MSTRRLCHVRHINERVEDAVISLAFTWLWDSKDDVIMNGLLSWNDETRFHKGVISRWWASVWYKLVCQLFASPRDTIHGLSDIPCYSRRVLCRLLRDQLDCPQWFLGQSDLLVAFYSGHALLFFRHLNDYSSWYELNGRWGFITIYVAYITSALSLKSWVLQFEDDDDDFEIRRQGRWDFKATYKIWNNSQWLNSSNETSGLDRLHVQETTIVRFVLISITKLLTYEMVIFLFASNIIPEHFQPLDLNTFAVKRETYFRRLLLFAQGVIVGETLLHSVLAIQWIIVSCFLLQSCHRILALHFVVVPAPWQTRRVASLL